MVGLERVYIYLPPSTLNVNFLIQPTPSTMFYTVFYISAMFKVVKIDAMFEFLLDLGQG